MKPWKITAGTIARTLVLALALINQILTTFGYSPIPIEDELVVDLISYAFTAVAAIVSWWKNNSFTKAALAGDRLMAAVKNGEVEIEKKEDK